MSGPDLTEFAALSHPRRRQCGVGVALAALAGDERAQLEAALAQPNGVITAAAVSQWLERRGHPVKYGFVRSHRRQECTCYGE